MSKWLGIGLFVLFLCFPGIAKNGIASGLDTGLNVLMPTLFPYMVVSRVFLKTGGADSISRLLKIGNLSRKGIGILLPSLFCGYPTGARLSSLAYNENEITKKELFLLFAFGNIPGFGFTVAYVGSVLYNSVLLGCRIYVSYLLASLILCVVMSRRDFFGEEEVVCHSVSGKTEEVMLSKALVDAVVESSLAMVSLICFVCFFSALILYTETFVTIPKLQCMIAAVLEITTGLKSVAALLPIEFTVFFGGFSGLCVLFQSLAFDKKNAVNLLLLLPARSLYGLTSVVIFWLIGILCG